jgi:Putative DNA-binding domain
MRAAAMRIDDADFEARFAAALSDPAAPAPDILTGASAHRLAVYRNNIAISLIEALEARFPTVRTAVGDEFFKAMARVFIAEHPQRLPMLHRYGDEFPDFLRRFEPASDIPYLPDLAQVDADRTRAAYAADVEPLAGEALAGVTPDSLARMHVELHPSVGIVSSIHPIATIWGMNAGALPVEPIADWRAESAVIARPLREVEVHLLPPGGASFLRALAQGENIAAAAAAAMAAEPDFDLGVNLALLFNFGLATGLSFEPHEGQ